MKMIKLKKNGRKSPAFSESKKMPPSKVFKSGPENETSQHGDAQPAFIGTMFDIFQAQRQQLGIIRASIRRSGARLVNAAIFITHTHTPPKKTSIIFGFLFLCKRLCKEKGPPVPPQVHVDPAMQTRMG